MASKLQRATREDSQIVNKFVNYLRSTSDRSSCGAIARGLCALWSVPMLAASM